MKGVLLLSYGALRSIDDLPAFYTHIFHGQAVPDSVLEEAYRRFRYYYTADPLAAITGRQALFLEKRLLQTASEPIKVYTAMKHTHPFIHETVGQMIQDGITEIIAFPTSPLFSRTGTLYYEQQIRKALEISGCSLPVHLISHWHLHDGLVSALALRLQTALNWLSQANRPYAGVVFTAHSQPGLARANQEFIDCFEQLAAAVANKLKLVNWTIAYRSATPGQKWLEPDVKTVMEQMSEAGSKACVLSELLSVTENIEALFDCRVDCAQKASELGIEFAAAEFLNDADDFIDVLENIVLEKLTEDANL